MGGNTKNPRRTARRRGDDGIPEARSAKALVADGWRQDRAGLPARPTGPASRENSQWRAGGRPDAGLTAAGPPDSHGIPYQARKGTQVDSGQ